MTDQQIVNGVWAVVTVLIVALELVVADAILKAMDPTFRWIPRLSRRGKGKRRKISSR